MFSSFIEARGGGGGGRERERVRTAAEEEADDEIARLEEEAEEVAAAGGNAGLGVESGEEVRRSAWFGPGSRRGYEDDEDNEDDVVDARLSPAAQQLRLVFERAELVSTKLGNFIVERNAEAKHSLRERVRERDTVRQRVGGLDLPAEYWQLDVVDEEDEEDPEVGNPLKFARERARAAAESLQRAASGGNSSIDAVGGDARFRGVGDVAVKLRPAKNKCDLEGCTKPVIGTAGSPPSGSGLVAIKFVEPSHLCNLGRPMFPRRGHTMTSMVTNRDLIVFGGFGVRENVDAMKETSSVFANASIVEKARMRHITYGDTHLLKSIYEDEDEEYRKYGIGRYFCDPSLVGYEKDKDTWNGDPRNRKAHPGALSDQGEAAQAE